MDRRGGLPHPSKSLGPIEAYQKFNDLSPEQL